MNGSPERTNRWWPASGKELVVAPDLPRARRALLSCARRMGREERREGSRGPPEQEGGELGSAGGELSRTPAQRRAAQQGGEARMAASGHVGSDVAVHVGSQCWSEAFWISSDTLE